MRPGISGPRIDIFRPPGSVDSKGLTESMTFNKCANWVETQSEFRLVLALNLPYGNSPLGVTK